MRAAYTTRAPRGGDLENANKMCRWRFVEARARKPKNFVCCRLLRYFLFDHFNLEICNKKCSPIDKKNVTHLCNLESRLRSPLQARFCPHQSDDRASRCARHIRSVRGSAVGARKAKNCALDCASRKRGRSPICLRIVALRVDRELRLYREDFAFAALQLEGAVARRSGERDQLATVVQLKTASDRAH